MQSAYVRAPCSVISRWPPAFETRHPTPSELPRVAQFAFGGGSSFCALVRSAPRLTAGGLLPPSPAALRQLYVFHSYPQVFQVTLRDLTVPGAGNGGSSHNNLHHRINAYFYDKWADDHHPVIGAGDELEVRNPAAAVTVVR